jgi:hypothetical protein
MDDDGDKRISQTELKYGLKNYGEARRITVESPEGYIQYPRLLLSSRYCGLMLHAMFHAPIMASEDMGKSSCVILTLILRNFPAGLNLTDAQLEEVMSYFDKDRNGLIDFDEFLRGIRGVMNDRRKVRGLS